MDPFGTRGVTKSARRELSRTQQLRLNYFNYFFCSKQTIESRSLPSFSISPQRIDGTHEQTNQRTDQESWPGFPVAPSHKYCEPRRTTIALHICLKREEGKKAWLFYCCSCVCLCMSERKKERARRKQLKEALSSKSCLRR